MIRSTLHAANAALLLAIIACLAGALAGLIVLFPFVAGAWGLNLMALLAYENNWGPDAAPQRRHVGPERAVTQGGGGTALTRGAQALATAERTPTGE